MRAVPWRAEGDATRIIVRLTPRGGADAIDGIVRMADGQPVLAARVRALPESGEANGALIALFAKAFGLPKRDVEIVSGQTQRLKHLRLAIALTALEPALSAITSTTGEA
jgi:uncharacterized protein YggU (UPF0235/DUF167 family)